MKTEININEVLKLEIEEKDQSIFLDKIRQDYKIEHLIDDRYVLITNKNVIEVEVILSKDGQHSLKILDESLDVEVVDYQKQILKELGMDTKVDDTVDEICSPMPGTIIDILCKNGDDVKKGDTLLILEAMKMENSIKSPASGIVKEIKVSVGQNVEKNQSLIAF